MYAVIETGGKQVTVHTGDVIRVEKLDVQQGDRVVFDRVLMVGGDEPRIGTPTVPGAQVVAEVQRQERAKKILVFKKKRRKDYRRKIGHRQYYTELRVTEISV